MHSQVDLISWELTTQDLVTKTYKKKRWNKFKKWKMKKKVEILHTQKTHRQNHSFKANAYMFRNNHPSDEFDSNQKYWSGLYVIFTKYAIKIMIIHTGKKA